MFRDVIEGEEKFCILQREHPHFVCYLAAVPEKKYVPAMPIAGYNLWLVFNYVLRGKMLPTYSDVDLSALRCMEDMANWYLRTWVLCNEKKYKKYKIINDTASFK